MNQNAGNDHETSTIEAFLKQADIARQRQAWDDVVKIFQVALKQLPEERALRRGLAAAYVAKADRMGFKPMYQRAMEEYWRLVTSDPSDELSHEGLLTAAVKADQLGEVLEEYRARIARSPDVDFYRAAFKKIQALYLMRVETKTDAAPGGRFVPLILGRVAPIVALLCLVGWVVVRFKIGPHPELASPKLIAVEHLLGRTGSFVLSDP
ncbi:MAG: hypothetical protein IPP35_03700 [Elusimicrobia bacterium]|nr:hypothetical protein [Elusimicrobiota bacterium]